MAAVLDALNRYQEEGLMITSHRTRSRRAQEKKSPERPGPPDPVVRAIILNPSMGTNFLTLGPRRLPFGRAAFL